LLNIDDLEILWAPRSLQWSTPCLSYNSSWF